MVLSTPMQPRGRPGGRESPRDGCGELCCYIEVMLAAMSLNIDATYMFSLLQAVAPGNDNDEKDG